MIRKTCNYLVNRFNHYVKLILMTLIAIVLDVYLVFGIPLTYDWYIEYKTKEIYKKIVVASGQSNNIVPLHVVKSPIFNAYTDGYQIVIYTGIIENNSWDGVAAVLGHELAHHQLMHTRDKTFSQDVQMSEKSEALADKLGMVYTLKAGYDICKAREMWKKLKETDGDFLGETHPNYAYRYDQLNLNCGE